MKEEGRPATAGRNTALKLARASFFRNASLSSDKQRRHQPGLLDKLPTLNRCRRPE